MRCEALYLRNIVEATDHIAQLIASHTPTSFRDSQPVGCAMAKRLAASRQSPGLRGKVAAILASEC
jgi:hypothetical protein